MNNGFVIKMIVFIACFDSILFANVIETIGLILLKV